MPVVDVKRLSLPAQEWLAFSRAYSAELLMESGAQTVGGVRTHVFEGFLYTVMSLTYSQRQNVLEAWQLVPEEMFAGEVFDNRNWEDLALGRSRGDYTGYKVKVKGKPMICSKEVTFVAAAPTVGQISLAVAKDADESMRQHGWRAHLFSKVLPTWKFHKNHPVAIYDNGVQRIQVLMWSCRQKIEEFMLAEDAVLDAQLTLEAKQTSKQLSGLAQGCLF